MNRKHVFNPTVFFVISFQFQLHTYDFSQQKWLVLSSGNTKEPKSCLREHYMHAFSHFDVQVGAIWRSNGSHMIWLKGMETEAG